MVYVLTIVHFTLKPHERFLSGRQTKISAMKPPQNYSTIGERFLVENRSYTLVGRKAHIVVKQSPFRPVTKKI